MPSDLLRDALALWLRAGWSWAWLPIREVDVGARQTQGLPGVDAKVWEELASMTRSCNRYLEDSSWSPTRYVLFAATLHDELTASVRNLVAARRGLQFLEPGAGAY